MYTFGALHTLLYTEDNKDLQFDWTNYLESPSMMHKSAIDIGVDDPLAINSDKQATSGRSHRRIPIYIYHMNSYIDAFARS